MNIQRWPQTFHRPFEITRRQRRFLDKHLPRDARVNHRAVQTGGNMYLPCQAELFHHSPQLIDIPFFKKKECWSALFSYQCSAAQLRRPLKLLFSERVCFLRSGTPGSVPLPHTHLSPDSVLWWGEQRGEGWTLCLHHRRSGALCTLILDY